MVAKGWLNRVPFANAVRESAMRVDVLGAEVRIKRVLLFDDLGVAPRITASVASSIAADPRRMAVSAISNTVGVADLRKEMSTMPGRVLP